MPIKYQFGLICAGIVIFGLILQWLYTRHLPKS